MGIRDSLETTSEHGHNTADKEPVLDVRKRIESEMSSVDILKNQDGRLLTSAGIESDYQDEHLYRFINTPTFKSWYHGPTSERGEPLSFWHATGEYFSKFDSDRIASSRGFANLGAGYYLAYENDANMEFYLNIARGKQPDDTSKQLTLLNHQENISHYYNEITVVREKLRQAHELELPTYRELADTLNSLTDKILTFYGILEEGYIDTVRGDAHTPSAIKKIALLFNEDKRALQSLVFQVKSIKEKMDKMNAEYHKIKSIADNDVKLLEEKSKEERARIAELMPSGVVLQVFANIRRILDFNQPVEQQQVEKVKSILMEKSFSTQTLDGYLAKENSGESFYGGLTETVTGLPLKHHLRLEAEEKQVDTRPVSRFLVENDLYDATSYIELKRNSWAPFGKKTLVLYDTDDALIAPAHV